MLVRRTEMTPPRGDLDSRLPEARRSTSASPVREAVRFERQAVLGLVEDAVAVQVLERRDGVDAWLNIRERELHDTWCGRRSTPHDAVLRTEVVCAEADQH